MTTENSNNNIPEEVVSEETPNTENTEGVYITRDEDSDIICVWRKPPKGIWAPTQLPNCSEVNWQRSDRNVEYMDLYVADDFKKKFGLTIRQKTKKFVHLDTKLVNDESFLMMTPVERLKAHGKK